MKYLLDTDVISKRNGPNGHNIRRWLAGVDDSELAISVITIFEISRGVQKKLDDGETTLAGVLQEGLDQIKAGFAGRIFAIDSEVAQAWGTLAGAERKQWMDRGLVATAKRHGLVLVSCNSTDTKGRGVEVINPERDRLGRWAPDGTAIGA